MLNYHHRGVEAVVQVVHRPIEGAYAAPWSVSSFLHCPKKRLP